LQSGVFIAKREPFGVGFGVFDDSLPDGWGNLILDRYLKQKGIDVAKLLLTERLSFIGYSGRGALDFFPDRSVCATDEFVDFDRLASEAERMLTSDYTGDMLETLYKYGGSSGGARPKIFITVDNRQWLVKFKAQIDPVGIGGKEYDYSLLAKRCGINMPETRLFEGKYFGVERFDRRPEGKVHTVSAAGLLHADYRIPSLDYEMLLKLCLNLTRNIEEVYALFRLMVYNIVISNRDDHAKNFSFQCYGGNWHLSPAYDLLPSNGFNGYHTTTINGCGEPSMKDVQQVASSVGLNHNKVDEIIEQVVTTCHTVNMLNFSIK
jgi:serine/threonine-protein kinase HipA